jgi:hypothetical protein
MKRTQNRCTRAKASDSRGRTEEHRRAGSDRGREAAGDDEAALGDRRRDEAALSRAAASIPGAAAACGSGEMPIHVQRRWHAGREVGPESLRLKVPLVGALHCWWEVGEIWSSNLNPTDDNEVTIKF